MSDIVLALFASVPLLQLYFGLINFRGQAWISFAYLLGLLVAALIGRRWEQLAAGQLGDGLFLAIGIASVVSVNLQLRTWLGLIDTGMFDIWSMGLAGARPYANLGQPNQLATLLLWGLIACGWAFNTRRIGPVGAILMALYLLIGIALTQSRTAWIGLGFLTACCFYWRRLWRSTTLPWVVTALLAFFWACHPILRALESALGLTLGENYFRTTLQSELRLSAWKLFYFAALDQPWVGYGLTEIAKAQIAVAERFPPIFPAFGFSHNLFLDLVLWTGFPLGILVSILILSFFFSILLNVSAHRNALIVMCLGVVGIHAMLEFPLHYAYFLFPTGAFVGLITAKSKYIVFSTSAWVFRIIWLFSVLIFIIFTTDYFKVEESFRDARFEAARIGTRPANPPNTMLLTQLRENINFMRYEVHEKMSIDELSWLSRVGTDYPSGARSYKIARAYALNRQAREAQKWLKLVCNISSPAECQHIENVWAADAFKNELIRAVAWPQPFE